MGDDGYHLLGAGQAAKTPELSQSVAKGILVTTGANHEKSLRPPHIFCLLFPL